jgi:hypothetical protein
MAFEQHHTGQCQTTIFNIYASDSISKSTLIIPASSKKPIQNSSIPLSRFRSKLLLRYKSLISRLAPKSGITLFAHSLYFLSFLKLSQDGHFDSPGHCSQNRRFEEPIKRPKSFNRQSLLQNADLPNRTTFLYRTG